MAVALMVLCSISVTAQNAGEQPHGEKTVLYNGIELPSQWPPQNEPLTSEPQQVPYLKKPPQVIPIDVGRQLFVDDFLIQSTTLKRVLHHPEPYQANPVLSADRPWEMGDHWPMAAPFSGGVWFDPETQSFRMWYQCSNPPGKQKVVLYLCYATSLDGQHWQKPLLDVVPNTNIVLPVDHDSSVVWLDQTEKDPAIRYKMSLSTAQGAISVYQSRDGIHWNAATKEVRYPWVGDRNTVFYNPFRNVWVYSIRNRWPYQTIGRIRYYSESRNLAEGINAWKPLPWVGADRDDLRNPHYPDVKPELYALDATPYESLMVGLFTVWEGPENKICAANHIEKRNQVMLGFSRDGFHWSRPDRSAFLAVNETEGAWNWGNMQSVGGGFLVDGDRLLFYSSGRQRNDENWDSHSSTGLFFLRRDGFASMNAEEKPGKLTTRSVLFSGKYLFVNFGTTNGELRVDVLDQNGKAIPGFTAAETLAVNKDSTRIRIRWKQHSDLASLSGRPLRFRFSVRSGQLYSFWVANDPGGASAGYVAAGGPGFRSNRDTPVPAAPIP